MFSLLNYGESSAFAVGSHYNSVFTVLNIFSSGPQNTEYAHIL